MVNSVLRAVKLLEYLGKNEGRTVTDVSKTLGYPKSTTHEILATLEHENLVSKDQHNCYHLGLKLFELGSMAQTHLEIRRVAALVVGSLTGAMASLSSSKGMR